MWQALPEGRHLVIAILGKLEISLNDAGMSAGYLAPTIAQIMALSIRLYFVTQGVLQFFTFFLPPLWKKRQESLWEATLMVIFLKCLIRISLAAQFDHCPLSFHCACLKQSIASSSWQSSLGSRRNYPFWITFWYCLGKFVAIAYRSVSWRPVVFRLLQGSESHPHDFVKIFKTWFLLDQYFWKKFMRLREAGVKSYSMAVLGEIRGFFTPKTISIRDLVKQSCGHWVLES